MPYQRVAMGTPFSSRQIQPHHRARRSHLIFSGRTCYQTIFNEQDDLKAF